MRFGVRFDTKQQTGGSGEEPPVSSILESNSAKLRAKNSVLQSKMNNLCQISRQIFRRSFSRNSARYKTFMFLCQAPRLCQIDRLPCVRAPRNQLHPGRQHRAASVGDVEQPCGFLPAHIVGAEKIGVGAEHHGKRALTVRCERNEVCHRVRIDENRRLPHPEHVPKQKPRLLNEAGAFDNPNRLHGG